MLLLSDVGRQFRSIKHEILPQIESFLESGNYMTGGYVEQLEKRIAERLGVSEAIGVGNGTDALILTLDAFGIGEGDEVITTPYTFFATAEAISRRGARPVFADVDPVTYNLDPVHIEALITPRTKAIMPVHLFGQSAAMDRISAIARKHRLLVIEDACQAFGAEYRGQAVGSFGDAACFSFFPTKNLSTTGDGGIIVTSNRDAAAKIRKLRQHGSSRKYYHDAIGYNSRLDEMHAIILLAALRHIDAWNDRRRALAQRYRQQLSQLSYLHLPAESQDASSVYHLFCLGSSSREPIMSLLQQNGIQTGVYYPCPLHLQAAYKDLGYQPGDFPVAEHLSQTLFAIPMHPFLADSEQDRIISLLHSYGG